jgi:hypothetical protein
VLLNLSTSIYQNDQRNYALRRNEGPPETPNNKLQKYHLRNYAETAKAHLEKQRTTKNKMGDRRHLQNTIQPELREPTIVAKPKLKMHRRNPCKQTAAA